MGKFWLSLGLTLILTCWCGGGYYGFGTCAAFGQSYYSAPYADPLSQLLYYIAPQGRDQYYAPPQYYEPPQRYQRHETNRERRDRERYERHQTNREHQDRGNQGLGHQDRERQDRGYQRY
jgi:hypothetical protein